MLGLDKMNALAHVEYSADNNNYQEFLHIKSCPLMGPLQDVAMREAQTIVQTHLAKLHMLYFAIIHVLGWYILMNKLKMLLAIVLHKYPTMLRNVCKPSTHNLLQ